MGKNTIESMILAVIILSAFYGLVFYFANKILSRLRIKAIIKVVNEMVKNGELTKEQGESIIWIITYKPKK